MTTTIYPYTILIMTTLITWITGIFRMNKITIFAAKRWKVLFG